MFILYSKEERLKIKLKIILATIVTMLTPKISTSMTLDFILTQKTAVKKQNLLEPILLLLKKEFIQVKLSRILIVCEGTDSDYEENNFIKIENNSNHNYYIQINIGNNIGKTLLTKIIGFIINYHNKDNHTPFFLIVKKENINVRKILYNHNKKLIHYKLFTYMMRSFAIITHHQYNSLMRNARGPRPLGVKR